MPNNHTHPSARAPRRDGRLVRSGDLVPVLTDVLLREQPTADQAAEPGTLVLEEPRVQVEEGREFARRSRVLHIVGFELVEQGLEHGFDFRFVHVGAYEGLHVERMSCKLDVMARSVW